MPSVNSCLHLRRLWTPSGGIPEPVMGCILYARPQNDTGVKSSSDMLNQHLRPHHRLEYWSAFLIDYESFWGQRWKEISLTSLCTEGCCAESLDILCTIACDSKWSDHPISSGCPDHVFFTAYLMNENMYVLIHQITVATDNWRSKPPF